MANVEDNERNTQNRIVKLFQEQLNYTYYGNWEERENNSNIEESYLTQYLLGKGYSQTLINKALNELKIKANNYNEVLYTNNKNVYQLLRYGVKVKAEAGENFETVHLIDWKNPSKNNFAIAEEVTVQGNFEKRPDIVLYINGIAIGIIELKKSTKDLSEGIRQNLTNQQKEFIQNFFSTIQFCFAGNDSQGLRYGTIGTESKYYLTWKEDETENTDIKLDKYLKKICNKERIIEILYDFVLFDGGKKKLPRYHQYFGIKAAQEHVRRREGGIIWHTQGSGKSITMVLLAKWILANNPNARVAIITDRTELDKQIEGVFFDADEKLKKATSGSDLLGLLALPQHRLICSLVHKFGANSRGKNNFEEFIASLEANPTKIAGEVFVFVDECHRTQSGKMHKVMKAILPNSIFIGFTGTPLLKQDKETSLEVFGKYIHTYKYNQAVEDGVVLDLTYEARDIDQRLTSQERVDEWFNTATENLNDFQKAELKSKWGTMQKVLSSKSRMEKIMLDILHDFRHKPRLSSEKGTAILIAGSIYEACKYYELFQSGRLKNKCAIITSYSPSHRDIVNEETGENTETEKQFIYNTYVSLLNGKATETYEDESKELFKREPARMKLLIVVSKLLTGFDAPTCTYLYIDKTMQDHGLFQAICRVNRLDTEDKELGYIVDYKELFKKVENAVSVYTSELDYDTFEKVDCDILLKDRYQKGRERLDKAIEELEVLCEPVESPKSRENYIHYFCGNTEIATDLKATEHRRNALYKLTVALIRAYANIKEDIKELGYNDKELNYIETKHKHYLDLREVIKNASNEKLDIKDYEADMRHLIDNYIFAEEPRKISEFESLSLLEIIIKIGIDKAIDTLPLGNKSSKGAIAETIENNVRSKIVTEQLTDPAFFNEMSNLLDSIIKQRKTNAINYEEYLKEIEAIIKRVNEGKTMDTPSIIKTSAQKVLYNNLNKNADLAIQLDTVIKKVKKADWRDNLPRENEIKKALYDILQNKEEVERIFAIVKKQSDY